MGTSDKKLPVFVIILMLCLPVFLLGYLLLNLAYNKTAEYKQTDAGYYEPRRAASNENYPDWRDVQAQEMSQRQNESESFQRTRQETQDQWQQLKTERDLQKTQRSWGGI